MFQGLSLCKHPQLKSFFDLEWKMFNRELGRPRLTSEDSGMSATDPKRT